MKKILLLASFMILALGGFAQEYYTAVGIRGGMSQGFTVKHFVTRYEAVEGILAFRWGGFIVTGLYEFEQEINVPGLNWYYGFGAHLGYWDGSKSENPNWWNEKYDSGVTVIGADGILGMEYTFRNTPINLSLDWKPSFNLMGYSGMWADSMAISIRYTFK